MTRKDFVLIAAAVADAKRDLLRYSNIRVSDAVFHVAIELADALAATDPNFKRALFLEACGLPAATAGMG